MLSDNKNPAYPGDDTAERFAYEFHDTLPGWRYLAIPWGQFFRDTWQPPNAPDDGLTLTEMWAYAIVLPSGQDPVVLEFWNSQSLQANGATGCFDGGIVEISINGGSTWIQVPAVDLLTDPYDGPLAAGNPLAGVPAWCGDPQAYLNSIVDVSTWAGQTAKFRFRLASNSSTARTAGWNLDDVLVQSCLVDLTIFVDGFESGNTSAWSVTVP